MGIVHGLRELCLSGAVLQMYQQVRAGVTSSSGTFRQLLANLLAGQENVAETGGLGPGAPVEDASGDVSTAVMETPQPASPSPAPPSPEDNASEPTNEFVPRAPSTIEETDISETEIEALILKCLLNCGATAGREIADHIRLPFRVIEDLLRRLKETLLLVYKCSAPLSDYVYELTESGEDRAQRYSQRCTYFGAAPVSFRDYVNGVKAQSVTHQSPRMAQLRAAFGDLVLSDDILAQIGQAVNAGMGLFLYGAPGNGKTSIAERIVRAFGKSIWIPRAISVYGEIIRLYDPSNHILLDDNAGADEQPWIDRRWVHIRRPTIVTGGELTLDNLEITPNRETGVSEAPLQMKASCGTLVIDDFGRQRMSVAQLLNRWIVPLEKRYDFLNLANGRKIQVPFDELIIFSTNLEPKQLVDEAFLRRIPYKIDVEDPTEEQFRNLFRDLCDRKGIAFRQDEIDYLIERYYKATGRPMRFCHPRDLLRQVSVYCQFHERSSVLSREAIDAAIHNYFAIL